jgi:hypothetical protein
MYHKKGTKLERRKVEEMKQIRLSYILTYIEVPQGNSLHRYFKQNSLKSKNRMTKQILTRGEGLTPFRGV